MIKDWLITGDTHAEIDRYECLEFFEPETAALIVLGDAGFNYTEGPQDIFIKDRVSWPCNYIYCVRGNHEMRPQDVPTMVKYFDENVLNYVYYELEYPYIRYFIDGYCYNINGHLVLVIGGAYSVDKYFRLEQGRKWFPNEQLTKDELDFIYEHYKGEEFDIILTHTCPYSWRPVDLFLPSVDSKTIDNTMELWMDEFKDVVSYNLWAFGHFHDDRLVNPKARMMFKDVRFLEDIYKDLD